MACLNFNVGEKSLVLASEVDNVDAEGVVMAYLVDLKDVVDLDILRLKAERFEL